MVTELPLPDAPAAEPRLRIVGPAEPSERGIDEALIAAIIAGDHAALGRLYDRHADIVFAIIVRILGDRGAAEEVLQEVFLGVWRQARLYDADRGTVRHWLLRIAHNRAVNERRRLGRRPQAAPPAATADGDRLAACIDPQPEPAETAWRAVRNAGLAAALGELPHDQRVVIELYAAGFSQSEIAAKLDKPLGTVKSRMQRGFTRLREALPAIGIDAGSTID